MTTPCLEMLSVINPIIVQFYKKNPSLDFETVNILLVEILEKLIPTANTGVSASLADQILQQIKQMQTQMQSQTQSINTNITSLQNDTISNVTLKMMQLKQEYIEDIKMVLTNNVAEKIAPMLKEYNSSMMDKTHLLLNDVLPKNNDLISKQFGSAISSLHSSITEDTNKFLSATINPRSLQDFITNLEQKFLQSEQRLESNLKDIKVSSDAIKELSTANQQTSNTLNVTVHDMLRKMDNAPNKGKISENIVFNILTTVFPTAVLDYVGERKETGDIMLARENKPTILIENKNWESIVSKEEVKKFIHDVETQNCSGLFLSQNTGIANKRNFEICIHNRQHVLLFMHNVNYDAEKIKLGVEIIDHFKETLNKFSDDSENDIITKETLDLISKEFQECCSQKLSIIKTVKDMSQKVIKQVDDIAFPNLETYLSSRYTFSVGKMVCEFCNFIAKNQQALSAHYRGCAAKKLPSSSSSASNPAPIMNIATVVSAPEESVPTTAVAKPPAAAKVPNGKKVIKAANVPS